MSGPKRCFKCKNVKPLSEFYGHPMMADGRLNKCKECSKSDAKKNRLAKIDQIRAYDRGRSKNQDRAKAAAEISAAWRKADKRRQAAHNAVARAIRAGKLKRKACSVCGSANGYAHHESYDRKLDVIWYCQVHHKERHKQMAILGIEP